MGVTLKFFNLEKLITVKLSATTVFGSSEMRVCTGQYSTLLVCIHEIARIALQIFSDIVVR